MATTSTDERAGLHKRSMRIAGHRTSLALENEFWATLDAYAAWKNVSIPVLIAEIDASRPSASSLASHVRVRCLQFVAADVLPTRQRNALVAKIDGGTPIVAPSN